MVVVQSLMMAAWMRLNGEDLREREIAPNGKIQYSFLRSDKTDQLIEQWAQNGTAHEIMVKYARLVSFEIRRAVRMRRDSGLRSRLEALNGDS